MSSQKHIWSGLRGSSDAFELARHAYQKKSPMLVLCSDETQAKKSYEDFEYFLKLHDSSSSIQSLYFPARQSDLKPGIFEKSSVLTQRLSVLYTVSQSSQAWVVFASYEAILSRCMPKTIFSSALGLTMKGEEIDLEDLKKTLLSAGYQSVSSVDGPGQFASRGHIFDLFSPHQTYPSRIEFFGDEVETMRSFDPESQRSIESVDEVTWIPAHEILWTEDHIPLICKKLKNLADHRDLPPSARNPIEEALRDQRPLPMYQQIFPLFYEEYNNVLDYLPKQTQYIVCQSLSFFQKAKQVDQDWESLEKQFQSKQILCCHPKEFFSDPTDVLERISSQIDIEISDIETQKVGYLSKEFSDIHTHEQLRSSILRSKKLDRPLEALENSIQEWKDRGHKIIFVVSNLPSAHRLQKLLDSSQGKIPIIDKARALGALPSISIDIGSLSQGFASSHHRLVLISEEEIFGRRKEKQGKQSIDAKNMLENVSQLNIGDAIVHIDFGIGIYRGLQRITVGEISNDFLVLEYQGQDKLFLPVDRLNRIHKYIGSDGKKPPVDRLGNQSTWQKTQAKAQKAVEEMAQELIALYAKRKMATGYAFSAEGSDYLQFESSFPFEETRDQLKAIEDVNKDMGSNKPMDRLICGDVGFGKTEVALRAAFRCVSDGKQAAVLVPTTILTHQHYETFQKRFEEFGIRVEYLSRFKTTSESKQIISDLSKGKIDIIIGTHKLLSKSIVFSDLGLLILDEEHRFGVKHKEHLQQYRNKIDVLTLTATPIPRTLQFSLTGIRDLSVISTPPTERKAVETIVCAAEDELLQNAIRKELARGGQVFFLHNRVSSIEAYRIYLQKLVPEASIKVGHGQMDKKQLEQTMHEFYDRQFDVLLCTTIIESGIDIPSANTMIIHRADRLGLAQLYQIRGRVGRADQNAFAYLLIPGEDLISKDASKRLKTLRQFTELGSGLKIALHDLEIRGAGNLLGAKQSGHIAAIGFEFYTQLLEREVRRLKGEKVEQDFEPEIQSSRPAYIPDNYISDQPLRLATYKKLSSCKTQEELSELREELTDRFGSVPPTLENLFEIISLKIVARDLKIQSIRLNQFSPIIEISDQSSINLDRLLKMMKENKLIRFTQDQKLSIEFDSQVDVFEETKKLLKQLAA
ncbi:MAG: transcription-repair coupling factor [Bdellovibrionales bacterium]|nr:transcription-repair coupling factor [Bdellovibrionales bacterium]